jgi:hypothetical protein
MEDHKLKEYFKFDDADLNANRHGVLSQKQMGRLKGERRSFKSKARIVGWIIGLGALILLGILFGSGVLNGSGILIIAIPLLFLMPLGVAGFLIFGRFADQNYSVKKAEGPIQLGMTQTYNQDGTTNQHYRLQIGDQSFIAEPDLSKIMTDGDIYRVYYADDWSEVLSVEHI